MSEAEITMDAIGMSKEHHWWTMCASAIAAALKSNAILFATSMLHMLSKDGIQHVVRT